MTKIVVDKLLTKKVMGKLQTSLTTLVITDDFLKVFEKNVDETIPTVFLLSIIKHYWWFFLLPTIKNCWLSVFFLYVLEKKLQGFAYNDWARSLDDSKSIMPIIENVSHAYCWFREFHFSDSSYSHHFRQGFEWRKTEVTSIIWIDNNKSCQWLKFRFNNMVYNQTKYINIKFYNVIRKAKMMKEPQLMHCGSVWVALDSPRLGHRSLRTAWPIPHPATPTHKFHDSVFLSCRQLLSLHLCSFISLSHSLFLFAINW